MKKVLALMLGCVLLFGAAACGETSDPVTTTAPVTTAANNAAGASAADIEALRGTALNVYSWGEYISDGLDGSLDVNKEFKKKYGIDVVYDTFDSNEAMYAKIKGGGVSYDVVVPSDYMIGRMIREDMLEKLNFANIPNYKNIAPEYKNLYFDTANEYSVPYLVGMIGLIYNTTKVTAAPDSWAVLWDADYKGKICMINNPRDAFAIAQALLGQDVNSLNEADWNAAAQKLKEQKPVRQSFVNDDVYAKMESGEAAMAPYFAGDYLTMLDVNEDLGFVYPKEGVNEFVDSACILKGSQNKLAAELYINFLLEEEIAMANAEYVCYASPNTLVRNNADYAFYQNEILYPTADKKPKTYTFSDLPQATLTRMGSLWDEVKAGVKD